MKLSLKHKAAFAVIIFAVVLTVGMVLLSYNTYTRAFSEHYCDLAMSVVKSTATMIDKDDVKTVSNEVQQSFDKVCGDYGGIPDKDAFTQEETDRYYKNFEHIMYMPQYQNLLTVLTQLRDDYKVESLYIGYTDTDKMRDLYLVDASKSGDSCVPGDFDHVESEHLNQIQSGNYELEPFITNYDEYGWLCSASYPIIQDGEVIAVALADISMNEIMGDEKQFLLQITIVIALLAALMIFIIMTVIDRAMLKPINLLSTAAKQFIAQKDNPQDGELSEISMLNIKTGDELELLSDSFKQMENDINNYIQNLTIVTSEKERIGAELSIATHIQSSMLPCIFPPFPEREDFSIFASMEPAKEVGGDFYDFFLIDKNKLAVVIADVSGKGVPAALFMVITKTLIKNYAQSGLEPSEVFTAVNEQLCENNDESMFVTAWMGILDTDSGKLTFVNAGHNPPLLKGADGEFKFLKTRPDFVLAGMEGIRYRQHEIELHEGDYLYLYTDGVTEATDALNNLYGDARLKEVLDKSADCDVDDLIVAVREDIDLFVKDAPQFDDITMLSLKINKRGETS